MVQLPVWIAHIPPMRELKLPGLARGMPAGEWNHLPALATLRHPPLLDPASTTVLVLHPLHVHGVLMAVNFSAGV